MWAYGLRCRHAGVGMLAVCGLMLCTRSAPATLYTNDTDWGGAAWSLANGDVVAGVHTNVGHLSIPAGATVTVQPYDANTLSYGRVTVFAASADIQGTLSANGSGFPAGTGTGAGTAISSTSGSGAGHGGRGGIASTGRPGDTYGTPEAPVSMGSGGGHIATYGPGGAGGGAIRLQVTGTLSVGGSITAHGGNGASRSGGGSGGSVWLEAGVVTGGGTIAADGGTAANALTLSGGGGGGRIAIDSPDNQFAGVVRAKGQPGFRAPGRNGTFNFKPDAGKDLVVGSDIALPPGTNWVFKSLAIGSGARLEVQSVTGSLAQSYADEVPSRLQVVNGLDVDGGGHLSADGLGYLSNQGPGAGSSEGGAGYGGRGGVGYDGAPGGTYGNVGAPTNLGSGGAIGRYTGGAGGGALLLTVGGTLTVDGTLSANGGNSNDRGGGGSGGSVRLAAAAITGNGTITADGGIPADRGGGGGGGRIAFDTAANTFTGTVRARGQTSTASPARNGTFNFASDPALDLVIRHDMAMAPGTNWVFRSLTVTNGARFEIQSVPGTAVESYTNDVASRIRLMGDVAVAVGATLTADGLGHVHGEGEGRGGAGGNGDGGGGGYGGRGGQPNTGMAGGTYGAAGRPDRLGSGGALVTPSYSGPGGGAVILDADGTIAVDGLISAHGGGANYRGGGGSGGSIWLTAAAITGAGTIAADGGKGARESATPRGGGGGGGRIALDTPQNLFTGTIRAKGNPEGRSPGRSGTFDFSSDESLNLAIAHDIALPPGTNWVFGSLTVTNGAIFEIQSVTGTSGAAYADEVASRVRILRDVTIASNSVLSVRGLGYRHTSGPGSGTVANNGGGGGSYGGLGGVGGAGSVGVTYGAPLAPDRLGSGGAGNGGTPGYGGSGGGALILAVGRTLTVDGVLSADGGHANVARAGGGSGGSVWLKAPRIAGSGSIAANGGYGNYESVVAGGGGGGGGRVLLLFGSVVGFEANPAAAVESTEKLAFSGGITVDGGQGFTAGAAGTIRFLYMPPPQGTLIFIQ